MEICLREVERCRRTGVKPNFIILLGNRYGWIPLPPRIEAREFSEIRSHMPSSDDRGLTDAWYALDSNAVPPEYCLRARTGGFMDEAAWHATEAQLQRRTVDGRTQRESAWRETCQI
jgi:hypothetical protein